MDFKLHYVPVLISGWFISSFIISYFVAVTNIHIDPIVPYISELGIWQPSSFVFAQLLNIGAVLVAVGMYIRYRQVDFAIKTRTTKLRRRWNELEYYLGFVCAIGISLVANFPGDHKGYRPILVMHFIGAFLAFGVGGVYLVIQTKITFDLQPYYNRYPKAAVSKPVQYIRLLLTICFVISFLVTIVSFTAFIAVHDRKTRVYAPHHTGYIYRLVSAIAEWVMAIIFFSYTVTATNEFKLMSFKEICFDIAVNNKKK